MDPRRVGSADIRGDASVRFRFTRLGWPHLVCLTGKSLSSVQPRAQKYFPFAVGQIRGIESRVSSRKRGVGQRHQRGTGCDGRGGAI